MNMTKGQMKEVLSKVDTLEKLLMRELEDTEVNYLLDHSIDEFLYDILGFEEEDLSVLQKIKEIISDWCTRPVTEINTIDENANLFFDNSEFEAETPDSDFFKDNRINKKISEILSNILSDLEKEKRKFVAKSEDNAKIEITSKSETPKEFDFNEEETFSDEECGSPISDEEVVSVANMIPDCAKKWISDLTHDEIADAIDKATDILVDDYIKSHESNSLIDLRSIKLNEDEIASEIVDQIKDVAINHYVSIIQRVGEFEFSDAEIQSEVLDYLYKHNYKVKSINNKVSLV